MAIQVLVKTVHKCDLNTSTNLLNHVFKSQKCDLNQYIWFQSKYPTIISGFLVGLKQSHIIPVYPGELRNVWNRNRSLVNISSLFHLSVIYILTIKNCQTICTFIFIKFLRVLKFLIYQNNLMEPPPLGSICPPSPHLDPHIAFQHLPYPCPSSSYLPFTYVVLKQGLNPSFCLLRGCLTHQVPQQLISAAAVSCVST